ncbi:HMA2 domain-containing protein [Desulfomonile tiedjei]|uniref:Uncharacterized protein n=1 Tax=Desulfomonile tiedjei (strain ATCC 49306 / DSM 6799 / DCB-1) TaxID=706587 RepID=I4C058_DESTA|nr:hypothetical protein [Desulfomonile tiedjei]AFM22949.1 hypothetical protein Desti_0203 [Desulfomonile tiedjei DSM 6799]
MHPVAHVCHTIPRRLRVRIPSKRGDSDYFAHVSEKLRALHGVEEVKAAPHTGSIVIIYDGELDELKRQAYKQGLFTLKRPPVQRKTLFQNVASAFRSYNKELLTLTSGQIDIPSLVFVSLVTSGMWQLARGNVVLPAWYVAFYYALGVFMHSGVDEFDEGAEIGVEDVDIVD